jgi:hypothetical protein
MRCLHARGYHFKAAQLDAMDSIWWTEFIHIRLAVGVVAWKSSILG